MPSWTPEQEQAIYTSGSNIIVSAGAGSGKTAVLTERVIEKLKNGTSINNLLILTFTNDAAHEMKDRIRDAISSKAELKEELDYIDSSYITTFDSFSLSIVKKYSYLLNMGNAIDIADPSIIYLEKNRILNDIFDRLYFEGNTNFLKMINDLTLKSDDSIKKNIITINDLLDLKYDKKDYLDTYINNYYSNNNMNYLIDSYTKLLLNKIKYLDSLLTDFSNTVDIEYFDTFKSLLNDLLSSSDYESIRENINVDLPSIPRNSSEETKEIKQNITNIIKEINSLTQYNKEELIDNLMSTKEYVSIIIDIIKELDERLTIVKKDMNMYDFSDISKMGIKILKNYPDVCEELKKTFHEIMIDEYQDTSDLQEEFISLIANNNVYVVGDIKQSIYGFRNANPYLFKEKYDNYSDKNGGIKIDLTKNFRSREEVVNDINLIFSKSMTDSLGGADYKSTHQMISGNDSYKEEGKTTQNNNLEIINYEYDKTIGFSKEEIEIFYIAQDIKEKVKNKYQVYDKKKKVLRDATYNDFTIILDNKKYFELYKKIFQYFKVPLTINTASNIVLEDEIVLIKNIIKLLIKNKEKNYDIEFKYAFTSVARSYLIEMNDQEIFEAIKNENYSSNLIDIINSIDENIDNLSINEIINEIINKFDFYSKLTLIGDINSRINRITSIIKIFDNLSKINYSINDVYDYLNKIIEDKYKIEVEAQDSVLNSVKIINTHKSKGLEYPICYFASLHHEFFRMDLNERLLYSKKYGIITPYYKEGLGTTFVKELYRNDYLLEDIGEKIRLFYVALTRAREKMIIVTSFPEKSITDLTRSEKTLDFLDYSKNVVEKYITNMDINKIGLTKEYNSIKKSNYKDSIEKSNELLNIKEINIQNELLSKEKISKETHSLIDKETKEKMKFGTKMHEILELLDFNNPNFDDLEIEEYFKEKIRSFISQINIEDVVNIYKEYEFSYVKDNNNYHGIIDLILEYSDSIRIIDYKLKNVNDDNYIKQLNSYKDYISTKTNKKIDIYLFSIIDGTLNKI